MKRLKEKKKQTREEAKDKREKTIMHIAMCSTVILALVVAIYFGYITPKHKQIHSWCSTDATYISRKTTYNGEFIFDYYFSTIYNFTYTGDNTVYTNQLEIVDDVSTLMTINQYLKSDDYKLLPKIGDTFPIYYSNTDPSDYEFYIDYDKSIITITIFFTVCLAVLFVTQIAISLRYFLKRNEYS